MLNLLTCQQFSMPPTIFYKKFTLHEFPLAARFISILHLFSIYIIQHKCCSCMIHVQSIRENGKFMQCNTTAHSVIAWFPSYTSSTLGLLFSSSCLGSQCTKHQLVSVSSSHCYQLTLVSYDAFTKRLKRFTIFCFQLNNQNEISWTKKRGTPKKYRQQ